MIGAALGILTASLLGSVHCAAMCGGFVCLYAGSTHAEAAPLRSHALYNVGRLVSYLLLGALAGALGSGISRLGSLAGVGHAATVVAGALMVGWGVSAIAAQRGIRLGFATTGAPLGWQRGLGRLLQKLRDQPVSVRAMFTGLGTTLLPCGWLYVFVASAGGTGSVRDGMLLMSVFWLGTVPAMLAVGLGAQRVFGPLRRKLPTLGAVTVLVMGLLAVSGRLTMSSSSHAAHLAGLTLPGASATTDDMPGMSAHSHANPTSADAAPAHSASTDTASTDSASTDSASTTPHRH